MTISKETHGTALNESLPVLTSAQLRLERLMTALCEHGYAVHDPDQNLLRFPKSEHQPCVERLEEGELDELCACGLIRKRAGKIIANLEILQLSGRAGLSAPELALRKPRGKDNSIGSASYFSSSGVDPKVSEETPLNWLFHRKNKQGVSYLSRTEFDAGERLRKDYHRADFNPGLGMSWTLLAPSHSRSRAGVTSVSDNVLDARQRLNDALKAVGPEFAHPLVDVCCLLMPLGALEKARGWPVRSGKIVVKLGLQALARHYGLARMATGAPSSIRQVGSLDYRPTE